VPYGAHRTRGPNDGRVNYNSTFIAMVGASTRLTSYGLAGPRLTTPARVGYYCLHDDLGSGGNLSSQMGPPSWECGGPFILCLFLGSGPERIGLNDGFFFLT